MNSAPAKVEAAPLICVCALGIALCAWETLQQLVLPCPMHMWEGGMLSDSYRSMCNLPVYEEASAGHATHMYGPLTTWVVGVLFKWTQPGFLPGRLVSLIGASLAIAALVLAVRPKGSWLAPLVAVTLLLGVGRALRGYVDPRPDAASLLFAILALIALYRGYQQQRILWHLAGLGALVVSFLFKQPGAMVCAVGVVAVVLERGRGLNVCRAAMLVSPFVTITALLVVLAVWRPAVFHYLVAVPAQYAISPSESWRWLVRFPLSMPLLWVVLALWLRDSGLARGLQPKLAWIVAALLVAAPCGIIAAAKTGGMANSLIPAYFAAMALLMQCGGSLQQALLDDGNAAKSPRRRLLSATAALLLLASILEPRLDSVRPDVAFGDTRYQQVITLARELEDRVVCPQDPSIATRVNGGAGRCLVFEYDQSGWPADLPEYFFDELADCRYAITIGKPGGWRSWPLTYRQQQDLLRRHGYEPLPHPALEGSVYTLWKKAES